MLHGFRPRLKVALAAGGALMLAGCGAVGAASLGWSAESPSAVRWRGAEGALPGYAQVSRVAAGPFAPAFAALLPAQPVDDKTPRAGGLFDVLGAVVAQPPFGMARQAPATATSVPSTPGATNTSDVFDDEAAVAASGSAPAQLAALPIAPNAPTTVRSAADSGVAPAQPTVEGSATVVAGVETAAPGSTAPSAPSSGGSAPATGSGQPAPSNRPGDPIAAVEPTAGAPRRAEPTSAPAEPTAEPTRAAPQPTATPVLKPIRPVDDERAPEATATAVSAPESPKPAATERPSTSDDPAPTKAPEEMKPVGTTQPVVEKPVDEPSATPVPVNRGPSAGANAPTAAPATPEPQPTAAPAQTTAAPAQPTAAPAEPTAATPKKSEPTPAPPKNAEPAPAAPTAAPERPSREEKRDKRAQTAEAPAVPTAAPPKATLPQPEPPRTDGKKADKKK